MKQPQTTDQEVLYQIQNSLGQVDNEYHESIHSST